ncbi:MAG: PEP-CTERM sorting domain-containing protein [bacterium]|nr:PEP-CTERM sorting domain-containing protein [bacterium]
MVRPALWVGACISCASVSPVFASTITFIIEPSSGSTEQTGSTAAITLAFFEYGADDLMSVEIVNTTPGSIGSKLTAVGFELPDTVSLALDFAPIGARSFFDTLTFDDSIAPGWLDAPGGYDLMLTSDGNFEGGSPQGGPAEGETEQVVLSLGDTGQSPAELASTFFDYYSGLTDNFIIARFQAVGPNGADSDKVGGYVVPEPSTWLLVGAGLLAFLRRCNRG